MTDLRPQENQTVELWDGDHLAATIYAGDDARGPFLLLALEEDYLPGDLQIQTHRPRSVLIPLRRL